LKERAGEQLLLTVVPGGGGPSPPGSPKPAVTVVPGGVSEERPQKRGRVRPTPLAESGYLITPSDRIHKAAVEALAPGALRPPAEMRSAEFTAVETHPARFWAAYAFKSGKSRDHVRGVVGFVGEPTALAQEFVKKGNPLAIKAQFALWARVFAETDAEPGQFARLTFSQFCDDLGYVRKKRAHRPERRQEAHTVLQLLTSLELVCVYHTPNGKQVRLSGPLWLRGLLKEEARRREEADEARWDLVDFSVAPGHWFAHPEWRRFNRRVALVGEGLLQLRTDRDQWAILLGGYICTQVRMNGYHPIVRRVDTLMTRCGLLLADPENPRRRLEKLEEALEKLVNAGVLSKWDWTGTGEEPDMDDSTEVSALADVPSARCVKVWWPADIERREAMLQARHEQRIAEITRGRFHQAKKSA
jgi:hypothetical protein